MSANREAGFVTALQGEQRRVTQLGTVIETLFDENPPKLIVDYGTGERPMAFMGQIETIHPGDTVVWSNELEGAPLVLGKLPMKALKLEGGDPWHEIGAAGEPPFEAGWANYDPALHSTAGFYKQSDGWVRLKGLVKSGTLNDRMFHLPDGYRPEWPTLAPWYFSVISNGTVAYVAIDGGGGIRVIAGGSNAYVSLNGITFPTASNFAQWLLPKYGVGIRWSGDAYNDKGNEPRIFLRDDGWCYAAGLIANVIGAPAAGATALELPEMTRIRRLKQILPCTGFGMGRLDLHWSGNLVYEAGMVGAGDSMVIGGMSWFGTRSIALEHPLATGGGTGNWLTLVNGWTNHGNEFEEARYYVDYHGVVHLIGVVNGSGSTSTTIATLPVGARPAQRQHFLVVAGSNQIGRIDVLPDGTVVRQLGSNAWMSLNGISFRADQ